jgi:hypothetical protein
MSQLAPYCKAYPATKFQEFAGWIARDATPSTPTHAEDGQDNERAAVEDYWFLQDTYVVTRGILPDEDIVFDQVSPEWIAFCRTTLGFAIPDDLIVEAAEVADAGA